MYLARFVTAVFVSMALAIAPAAAKKVALVIGNADYQNTPGLQNTLNDAKAMSETFANLGFEVITGLDLDQVDFATTLLEFDKALEGAETAAFYYAGHGIQFDGENFLVSTNAAMKNVYLMSSETIALDTIVAMMEAKSPVNMVFLDACRDNPLVEKLQSQLPRGRSGAVTRGLAPVEDLGPETMIMYATASNDVAEDGLGEHSPFAEALLRHLPTPDTEVGLAMKRVIRDVREATDGQQSPELLTALSVEIYLNITVRQSDEPAVGAAPNGNSGASPADVSGKPDAEAFALAQSFNSIAAWQAFLKSHPDGFYSDLARVAYNALLDEATRPGEITTSAEDGLVGSLYFPLAGRITSGLLNFRFTTECENDHEAVIISPAGRRQIVMDRGRHRCGGGARTYDGPTDITHSIAGSEALGTWRFIMKDLDVNEHSGTLDSVSLSLTVDNGGVSSSYTVSLDELPQPIPNGSSDPLVIRFEGEVPPTLQVLVRTENTLACDAPCNRSELVRMTVPVSTKALRSISVPLPSNAMRACVIMEGAKAVIEKAELIMGNGDRFISEKGGDLDASGRSACSLWTVDAGLADYWLLTLATPNGNSGLSPADADRELDAPASDIKVSPEEGLVGSFYFPLAGKITSAVLDFAYTTECENDHLAWFVSPTGQRSKSWIEANAGVEEDRRRSTVTTKTS